MPTAAVTNTQSFGVFDEDKWRQWTTTAGVENICIFDYYEQVHDPESARICGLVFEELLHDAAASSALEPGPGVDTDSIEVSVFDVEYLHVRTTVRWRRYDKWIEGDALILSHNRPGFDWMYQCADVLQRLVTTLNAA